MTDGLTMDSQLEHHGTGTEQASVPSPAVGSGSGSTPISDRAAVGEAGFSYSTDGTTFTTLGPAFTLDNTWAVLHGLSLRHL